MNKKGKVYLVGAGPGDPELITLKAIGVLKQADVVLYDALAHSNLLRYCSTSCVCIKVGKRKGQHSQKQSSINQKLIDYAQKGHCVVRLKGGDPLIFGRGGEEIQCLADHNIEYEIVPGITSAIAVPSYAGIPLTHRNLSRSVAFVTGTLKKGKTQLDIPKADTLVFLMAVTNLEDIVSKILSDNHFSSETPAAIIYHGTLAKEDVVIGTLATIIDQKNQSKLTTPAIVVVGSVVNLAKTFNWRATLPLAGKRIITLRDQDQSEEYTQYFSQLGAEAINLPMIKISPNTYEQQKITRNCLESISMIILTSQNSATYFLEALKQNQCDLRTLFGKKIIAIGKKTKDILSQSGIIADMVPKQQSTAGILAEFSTKMASEHVLLPLSSKADQTLENGLKQKGAKTTRINIYNNDAIQSHHTAILDGDHVVFTSSSTVENFFNSKMYTTQHIHVYSIGEQTTSSLKQVYDGHIYTAAHPSLNAIAELMHQN